MILQLENLYYRYHKKAPYILNGVSYTFDAGRLYAIMGGSGSGKTTLISLIAALDKPTDGKIYYNGTDIAAFDADDYRAHHVSIIFQSYNLLYNYTALDNVATILYLGGYTGNHMAKAAELLSQVGISAEKHRYAAQNLSGGEQQRVAIARAVASQSDIILADEPTGNLDKPNQENIMGILKKLAREDGKCVIVVTHAQSVAEAADDVLYIADGKLT